VPRTSFSQRRERFRAVLERPQATNLASILNAFEVAPAPDAEQLPLGTTRKGT